MSSVAEDIGIRFDHGNLLLGSPVKTADGFLRAKATFARDGILEYIQLDGTTRRELRTSEENQRIYQQYGRVPLTLEHPPRLLTPQTATEHATGSTDGAVFYDSNPGFIHGEILSYDDRQIRLLENGEAVDISSGYRCQQRLEPGIWRGERYDSIQVVKDINHVCTTSHGRSGEAVGVKMDSDRYFKVFGKNFAWQINNDSDIPEGIGYVPQTKYFDFKGGSMSGNQLVSTQIGKTTYKVDSAIAPAIENLSEKADSLSKENEKLKQQLQEAQTKNDSLGQELSNASSEIDSLQGRCDTYEVFADSAKPVLEEAGYYWDAADSNFYEHQDIDDHKDMDDHQDMDNHEDMDDHEDMMEYGEDDDEEGKGKEGKGKTKKDMSGHHQKNQKKEDCKTDSAVDIVAAYQDAKTLIPDLEFDPAKHSSVVNIKKDALTRLDSTQNYDGKDPGYIEGSYDAAKRLGATSRNEDRQDSRGYVRELELVTQNAQSQNTRNDDGISEKDKARQKAHKKPLSMSKRK